MGGEGFTMPAAPAPMMATFFRGESDAMVDSGCYYSCRREIAVRGVVLLSIEETEILIMTSGGFPLWVICILGMWRKRYRTILCSIVSQ